MVKHTQTNRLLLVTNCLGLFDHFVGSDPKKTKMSIHSMTFVFFQMKQITWLFFFKFKFSFSDLI